MRAALLSNVNVESLGRRIGRHEVHIAQGFGAWTQELANPASETWAFNPAAVFLVVDGAELLRGQSSGLAPSLAELDGHLGWIEQAAARAPSTKFFVSMVDVPPQALRNLRHPYLERRVEEHWRRRLCAIGDACPNVYAFDLKVLVEEVGRAQFYSAKRWYLGGLRFSVAGEKLVARELERILDAQAGARKKCLLVDLDNTLWGGVIGEDGLKGIQLGETGEGARFKDFQRRVKQLGEMGVILGVVSKNNDADVFEVFDHHEHMVLKRSDFASLKINWGPKPQNIADVAQELDIGRDSLVFIDDNPVEREAVRTALPEVTVPEFPEDSCELAHFLEQVYRDHFFALESTDEDRKRTEAYLANAKRAAERSAASSIDEFLSALGTKIVLGKLRDDDVARAAQLTQKTNQFNLTTRRYTEQEIQEVRTSPCAAVYIASVADKYGDNGKVLLGIVRKHSADTAELDTFLMSCRVMGRFIEDQVLDHLVRTLRSEGITRLRVQLVPTKKNPPARTFLERLSGGQLISENEVGARTWEFDIAQSSPVTRPAYAELSVRS
jgi:FkbH-like protein